jgi:hypothetical protein
VFPQFRSWNDISQSHWANDERSSFPTPGLNLNDVTILERNLGNVCLGEMFSNNRGQPDEWMFEPPLSCTQEIILDAEMDIDRVAYYYPNFQHLPGPFAREEAEETVYHNVERARFNASRGRHEEIIIGDDFEPMDASDDEDIYNLPHDFFSP